MYFSVFVKFSILAKSHIPIFKEGPLGQQIYKQDSQLPHVVLLPDALVFSSDFTFTCDQCWIYLIVLPDFD